MKTLIVYYSFTRNNELLAKALRERMNCHIHKIEESGRRTGLTILLDLIFRRNPRINPLPFSLRSYDQCIFVAPVWAGRIASPLRALLLKEKHDIKSYSFITVCGGGNSGQREKLTKELAEILGQEPRRLQELWVVNLLPKDKPDTIKNTSGYRIAPADVDKFSAEIDDFVSGSKLHLTSTPGRGRGARMYLPEEVGLKTVAGGWSFCCACGSGIVSSFGSAVCWFEGSRLMLPAAITVDKVNAFQGT